VKVRLHPDAEKELDQAARWYEGRDAGLGEDLLAEVDRRLGGIAEAPHTWPRWQGTRELDPLIRRVLLRRFPFAIAYQAFDDRVWVLAIAHTSREPFYWASRPDSDGPDALG